jgi:anti-sigma B factor antagonist
MDLQPPDCCLDVEPRSDVILARFTRKVVLTGQAAETAAEQLASLLPELGRRRLLVDFGNVQSLSSLMLGKLIRLNRSAEEAGGRLALFNLSPNLRQIMEVTRLNFVLLLYDGESDALQGS